MALLPESKAEDYRALLKKELLLKKRELVIIDLHVFSLFVWLLNDQVQCVKVRWLTYSHDPSK